MKKALIVLNIFLCSSLINAQDGAEHKITNIIGAGRIEINIGSQNEVKIDDIFQVFGKGQVIHPATGKLVERDNVFIGKVKIIETKELTSVAEIVEKSKDFSVGNKVIKVVTEEQPVIQNKRPVQAEFENPEERKYSETIYTQKTQKLKPGKEIHIIDIKDENNQVVAIVDKGNKTKGRAPKTGKKYYVYTPKIDTSTITGQQQIDGEDFIGKVIITTVDYDASKGKFLLNKEIDYDLIIKDNHLHSYVPKLKGWDHILRLNILSFNWLDGREHGNAYSQSGFVISHESHSNAEKIFSPLNGFEFINGYRFNPVYFIGFGLGYNNEYHKPFRDALIMNIPYFLHQRFNVFNKKNSISLNLSLGQNAVLNAVADKRPYEIHGSYFLAGGLGLKTYIQDRGALLFDVDMEMKKWVFKNYSEPDIIALFLKLKLGYEF